MKKMNHIKLFENFEVNELLNAKNIDDISDPEIKALYVEIAKIVEVSPITFNTSNVSKDYFSISGPFGISLNITWEKENVGSSYQANYKNTFVTATIDKTIIKANNAKELWNKLKKSAEFKLFIKGSKIEKLRIDRLKKIIKNITDATEVAAINRLLIDYIYYLEPKRIEDKPDNSGPWATSGTSIYTYNYDLKPLALALNTEPEELREDIEALKDDINKILGNVSRSIVSVKVTKFELSDNFILSIQTQTTVYYN